MDSLGAQAVTAQASEEENGQEFLASFDALAQAIRRARGAVAQDRPGQLTFSQYALLTPLATNHAARVSDLAAEASIAPSTATRILDALERRAIVRRDRSDEDRRQVRITLTELGRRTLCAQDEWMRGRQRAFFEELPDVERELVADLLLRLSKLIDELAAGPEG
ncbi:MAG: MarR family transcriptional regulator [Solirubrobacteraceae bacterium]